MRLSDAIALGRVLVKQWTSSFFLVDGCRACAIGAAHLAMGKTAFDEPWLNTEWPWLNKNMQWQCVEKSCYASAENAARLPVNTGTAVVSHLMGHVIAGKITLDQLIDWVRSVEPAEEAPEQQIEKNPDFSLDRL